MRRRNTAFISSTLVLALAACGGRSISTPPGEGPEGASPSLPNPSEATGPESPTAPDGIAPVDVPLPPPPDRSAGPARAAEIVTCVFHGSESPQHCYSSAGECEGVGRCSVDVTGPLDAEIVWKSSCGGYASTTIDGQPETAEFRCTPETVSETVQCVFKGGSGPHRCSSKRGSCKGLYGCSVTVTGPPGEVLTWSAGSCLGLAETTLDGQSEKISFHCI